MDEQKVLQYSQASLQDFADCHRRFFYRYIAHLAWPAVESEPVIEAEKLMQSGEQFHLLLRQYFSGVPVDKLEESAFLVGDLREWWQNFLAADLELKDAILFPEKVLTVPLGDTRLVGKFDLVAMHPDGRTVIYDWKTSQRMPSRQSLAARWQTIVYPYLLAKGGAILHQGAAIQPDKISMVYWYTNFPDQPIVFQYSAADMEADEQALLSLIREIESRNGIEEFELALDEKYCKYCVYRSLCDRGIEAGGELEMEFEPETEFNLDFDQIQEIEF